MPIENIEDYNEALEIIENSSYVDIERKHLEAAIEMVQHRESTITALRNLLNDVNGWFAERNIQGGTAPALRNRINNTLAITWPEKDIQA